MNKKITNFALNLDKDTKKQFEKCINKEFVIKASLMPDAHFGYIAPIGSVIVTKDVIVPAWVGYDIGCGMLACKIKSKNPKLLEKIQKKSKEIFNDINKKIPMGKSKLNHIQNVSNQTKEKFKILLKKLKDKEHNPKIFKIIKDKSVSNLGTLGSGNHFIELGIDKNKEIWIIVHSGSRNIGHIIATNYMKIASNNENKYEITASIKADTQIGKEYLNLVEFSLEFALLNRIEMINKIIQSLKENLEDNQIDFEIWTNKHHNHVIKDEQNNYIHRKGATPALKNERGVIPANMRDGSFLVEGLGNKDFLMSSSHGAGRLLSRKEAKKQININDFKKTMQKITANISENTIDESPFAYKNIYDVMDAQKKSIKIINHIKPIINWKGE